MVDYRKKRYHFCFKDTHRKKKHRQMKLQRFQKVGIWAFGLLVHQINSL